MRSPPEISILMPVRDGAAHLDEAVASLAAQALSDFELIVVDDGSTDGTAERLRAWAARDKRVCYARQEPLGIVAALEHARALARGVYLARMDADDVAHPERLERQHALMASDPALVACGCGVEYFPATAVRGGARRYQRWLNAAATPRQIEEGLFVECPLAHPTFFLRAEAVARVGGYRDRGWPEDYDLLLRLWAEGGRLGKVPDVLLRWREGAARLSRTHERYDAAAFRRCKAHFLAQTLLKGREAVVIWGAGPVGKGFSRALAAEGVGVAAFVEVDRRKIGQEIHGAPVLDADDGLAVAGAFHLAAVGQPGVRDELRRLLIEGGRRPLRDFVAVA